MRHSLRLFFRITLAGIMATLVVGVGRDQACAAAPQKAKTSKLAGSDAATAVKTVRVPDRGVQPQALVDTEGTLHLIYLGDEPGKANVYYVSQAAGADKLSKPVRVNSQN